MAKRKNIVGNEFEDGIDCQAADDGMTKEEPHKSGDTDINKMVARFERTGVIERMADEPFYGDVSELVDFQEALNVVTRGRQLFDSYPADVRDRFQNDPARFIKFLDNPDNLDEAVKLGIAVKRPVVVPKPEDVPPVADAGGAAPKP